MIKSCLQTERDRANMSFMKGPSAIFEFLRSPQPPQRSVDPMENGPRSTG